MAAKVSLMKIKLKATGDVCIPQVCQSAVFDAYKCK